jgi:phosphoglycolate phosphatase-like HAD superfamily hydrolase
MQAIGVVSGSATAEELAEAGASFTVDDLNKLIPFARDPALEATNET